MKERLSSIKTYRWSAGKQDDKRGAFRSKWGHSGYPAASCWKMMASLGMSGQTRKRAVSAMTVTAERASSWLWLRRKDGSRKPGRQG